MGYTCPRCGEGLPGDTSCPCTTGPGGGAVGVVPRFRALTPEIDDTSSPVRQFLDERFTCGLKDLFQVIGYALLDFDNEYKLTELGIFNARYAYPALWDLARLLDDLAGHQVSLPATRQEFRQLLLPRLAGPGGELGGGGGEQAGGTGVDGGDEPRVQRRD